MTQPLAGMCVLDFSTLLPGALATLLPADAPLPRCRCPSIRPSAAQRRANIRDWALTMNLSEGEVYRE